jgi:hypothetical protein
MMLIHKLLWLAIPAKEHELRTFFVEIVPHAKAGFSYGCALCAEVRTKLHDRFYPPRRYIEEEAPASHRP